MAGLFRCFAAAVLLLAPVAASAQINIDLMATREFIVARRETLNQAVELDSLVLKNLLRHGSARMLVQAPGIENLMGKSGVCEVGIDKRAQWRLGPKTPNSGKIAITAFTVALGFTAGIMLPGGDYGYNRPVTGAVISVFSWAGLIRIGDYLDAQRRQPGKGVLHLKIAE